MGKVIVGLDAGRHVSQVLAFLQHHVDQARMTAAPHGDGDGHGIGHALDGAGGHGMAHGTATAEVGEGGAAGHHGFEQGTQHGVRAGVPAGGGDADAVAGPGGGIQTRHGGGDLGVDIEAVYTIVTLLQKRFRRVRDAARRPAQGDDVRAALGSFQAGQIGEFGQAAQGLALRTQGFGTTDHAEALAIRSGKGRFHHTGTDIAETVDGKGKLFHMHSFGKKTGAAFWPLARLS